MTSSPHITPQRTLGKESDLKASLDVNDFGHYGLSISDELLGRQFWLTTTEARELLGYLQDHLAVLCVLEGNNIASEQELTKTIAAHPEEEEFYTVEWDPRFWGGDYDGMGDIAYVPAREVCTYGIERAFMREIEEDPAHIIHYDDETVTRAEIDADEADTKEEGEEEDDGDNEENEA